MNNSQKWVAKNKNNKTKPLSAEQRFVNISQAYLLSLWLARASEDMMLILCLQSSDTRYCLDLKKLQLHNKCQISFLCLPRAWDDPLILNISIFWLWVASVCYDTSSVQAPGWECSPASLVRVRIFSPPEEELCTWSQDMSQGVRE